MAHHRRGELDEAEQIYRQALQRRPDSFDATHLLGLVLVQRRRIEDGERLIAKALEIEPSNPSALNNHGNALKLLGRTSEALACYERAIAAKPDYAEAHHNRGNALRALDRDAEALASYDRALALKPGFAEAHHDRGNALKRLGRTEQALASYDAAIACKPDLAEAHSNRGIVLKELDRIPEALASYDAALAYLPGFADAHHNRAHARLLTSDLEGGWRDFEHRWRTRDFGTEPPNVAAPHWNGEPLSGRRLLVYAEQGLGDTIQFTRYLPLLRRMGAEITFFGPRSLFRILRPLTDGVELVGEMDRSRRFDFQCALMGLPLRFGTDLDNIPGGIPYLDQDDATAARWGRRLGGEGFKIGIAWQGAPAGVIDVGRSIPLCEFQPLGRLAGVRLISLQKNHGLEQLEALPAGMTVETLGDDFDAGPDAFVDTVAVMRHLDLIVTSDTAIAHVGGALGRPTWVALKRVPDWRWLRDRADSPWYPTVRLFRQHARGDWRPVFQEIAREAGRRMAGDRAPRGRRVTAKARGVVRRTTRAPSGRS